MARSAIAQSSARPSLMVCSIARPFGTGSAPGCARQIGHVPEFSCAPYSSAQRQNIFVRVFRCACTSRPMTGSQSDTELLPRFAQRALDVLVHLDHADAVLEHAVPLDQPQLALARLELELDVAEEHRARAVEDARRRAEDALHRGDELRCGILESHAARRVSLSPGGAGLRERLTTLASRSIALGARSYCVYCPSRLALGDRASAAPAT